MRSLSKTLTAALAAALLVLVAGCGGSAGNSTGTAGGDAAAPAGLAIRDSSVKAVPKEGAMPMSAIFGVLTNGSDQPITIVRGSTDAASKVELHEMVMKGGAMEMQERAGGFVVPPKGELALEPGGLHVMLIGLTRDIKAGETVTATLTTADGQELTVDAVGRDLPNANESYDPGDASGDGW